MDYGFVEWDITANMDGFFGQANETNCSPIPLGLEECRPKDVVSDCYIHNYKTGPCYSRIRLFHRWICWSLETCMSHHHMANLIRFNSERGVPRIRALTLPYRDGSLHRNSHIVEHTFSSFNQERHNGTELSLSLSTWSYALRENARTNPDFSHRFLIIFWTLLTRHSLISRRFSKLLSSSQSSESVSIECLKSCRIQPIRSGTSYLFSCRQSMASIILSWWLPWTQIYPSHRYHRDIWVPRWHIWSRIWMLSKLFSSEAGNTQFLSDTCHEKWGHSRRGAHRYKYSLEPKTYVWME